MSCSVSDAGAEVGADDVGGDDRDAFLADAADLRRAARERDVGDRRQRHRPLAARVDDQVADLFDRRRARVDAAHEHVDLLVVEPVARGDFAAHALHDAVGDVANCEAELRRALLVEHDLDLGIAGLDGRAHVAEQRRREHARVHALGGLRQALEVVAA